MKINLNLLISPLHLSPIMWNSVILATASSRRGMKNGGYAVLCCAALWRTLCNDMHCVVLVIDRGYILC